MRPKLIALIAVSALALVGCAANETDNKSTEEQTYLDTVSGVLEPFKESTDTVSDERLLQAGYAVCSGESIAPFEDAGIHRFTVVNVVKTSANELCPAE